jgi:hypothetical protein
LIRKISRISRPMNEKTRQTAEQAELQSPVENKRRKIVFAISTVLFMLAMLFPIVMTVRHLGSPKQLVKEVRRATNVPVKIIVHKKPAPEKSKRIAILLAAMAVLAAGRFIPRKEKAAQVVVTVLLVFLAVAAFKVEAYDKAKSLLQGKYIQKWNVFHYYFGAKYFDEMGYFYHYPYLFKAGEEGAVDLDGVERANDLFEYRLKPVEAIRKQVEGRNDFTPERWELFKSEMAFFDKSVSNKLWSNMVLDHGYNATPFWNTIGSFLANTFSIKDRASRTFILGLDTILLFATFIVIGWAWGLRWGVVSALVFFSFFGNRSFSVGGFIRYDWFCATAVSFSLFHKGYLKASAPFLAYAAMARIFPAFLLLGPGLLWLRQWIVTKKMDKQMFAMFVIFAVCCVLALGIGSMNKGGPGTWGQFYKNIKQHTTKHYVGPLRAGLKHMFIDDLATPKIADGNRREAFKSQLGLYKAAQILMLAMFFTAIWRRERQEAFLLGFMFIFAMLTLSRYYWALIGLMFLLPQRDGRNWRNAYSDILILSMSLLFYAFNSYTNSRQAQYMCASYYLFGYFVFLAGSYLAEDWFGLADWWKSRKQGGAEASAKS